MTDTVIERGHITAAQHDYLCHALKRSRISTRRQGGKDLSYLEAWDVKAHLTRIFGFGNWDLEMLDYRHVGDRAYTNDRSQDMIEAIYSCRMQLVIRDPQGREVARYSEGAVGSASGQATMQGDLHDNALKTAASDATKRCAINLGTQFGLSLYDDGNVDDVVGVVLVRPEGAEKGLPPQPSPAQQAAIEKSVGATESKEVQS
jgi:recombination DNA repair RAD52 pathway protein